MTLTGNGRTSLRTGIVERDSAGPKLCMMGWKDSTLASCIAATISSAFTRNILTTSMLLACGTWHKSMKFLLDLLDSKKAQFMNDLYIIRGLPGSGKTTVARDLADRWECNYYEADQYFETSEGEYKFDSRKLSVAHRDCFINTMLDLREGRDVIVANTFTTLRELQKYIDYARENGHGVTVIECTRSYGSIHNIPESTVEKMRQRWLSQDDLASIYKYDIITSCV